jgi:hypothetical protein
MTAAKFKPLVFHEEKYCQINFKYSLPSLIDGSIYRYSYNISKHPNDRPSPVNGPSSTHAQWRSSKGQSSQTAVPVYGTAMFEVCRRILQLFERSFVPYSERKAKVNIGDLQGTNL